MTQKDIDWCKYRIHLVLIQIKTEFDSIRYFFKCNPTIPFYYPGVQELVKRGEKLMQLKMEAWTMYSELCNMEVTNE